MQSDQKLTWSACAIAHCHLKHTCHSITKDAVCETDPYQTKRQTNFPESVGIIFKGLQVLPECTAAEGMMIPVDE